jgi:predicted transcriptional regulator
MRCALQIRVLLVILLGKNRDRLSIVAAILEAVNSGASKTRIMFAANLSFSLLEKYLAIALKAEFVRVENYKYSLTERGREFLKQYKHFEGRYIRAQTVLESLTSERVKLASSCERTRMFNGAN